MASHSFDVVVAGNAGVDTQVYLSGGEIHFEEEANFTENLDCAGQAGVYARRGYARCTLRGTSAGLITADQLERWPTSV